MSSRKITKLSLDDTPAQKPSESDPHTSPFDSILLKCIAELKSWKPPPNLSAHGWFQELQQLARIAAWQAICNYKVGATTSIEVFVYCRIMQRVPAWYRREWRYAQCFVPDPLSDSVTVDDDQSEPNHGNVLEAMAELPVPRYELLHELLANLPPDERYMIEELVWRGRTQEELGRMLGATQRAISREKQAGLRRLRDQLIAAESNQKIV